MGKVTARAAALGFTLIEIAIVLTVIGLIVAGGLTAVSPVLQGAKISETKQKLTRVESALLGYVISNSCLPCPADPDLPTSDGNSGDANGPAAGNFYTTGCASGCAASTGVVPWNAVGLSEDDVTDGWGRRLTYSLATGKSVSASMTRTTATPFPAPTASVQIQDLAGGNIITANVAYAILSHGQDGSFGYSASSGVQSANVYSQTSGGQFENGDADLIFATGSINASNSTAYFDDYIVYRTVAQVILACGTGSCGNPN